MKQERFQVSKMEAFFFFWVKSYFYSIVKDGF
ncbi:Uncharacterised protein [Hungatella hathewayi]|nr:Uncharacterised protein [Hungatella hathewayi]